ncbi:MAG: hypothetical protein GY772_23035 [bacterium]|nr:hypothetical protein [bacterium]
MLIEMNLDVRVGDRRTVCEVQVPCETEVHSYTPGERPSVDSPGDSASIEWTLRAAASVRVNGVEVLAEGAAIELRPVVRADIEDRLIRDAEEERSVSRAGY